MKNLSSELADTLLRYEAADKVIGCSLEEIAKLEEHFSVRLPAAYEEFLL